MSQLACIRAKESVLAKHPLFGSINLVSGEPYDFDEAEAKRLVDAGHAEYENPAVTDGNSDEQE